MTTNQTKGLGSKTGLIIGIVGAVAVLILVALVLTGTEEIGAEYGDPTITGDFLPPMPQGASVDTSATGETIPKLEGQDFDGSEVVVDPADGRAKGVVFLAHWCPHCQAEVPRVQEWIDATGGDPDVDIYSVSTSMNSGQPNYPPSAWLDREGWTPPVIRDNKQNEALISYGAGGFPYWVFTNSDGTVAVRTSGELTIDQLTEILDGLE
ncbi:MAG: TlpA family protein disulfide reductase [Acidimicrobiia bacterium]|nr:TlpA family protein disulfide reductase [Acidimicrobiia bacterium]